MNKRQNAIFSISWINSAAVLLVFVLGFSCGASKKLGNKDANLSSTELLVRRMETKQVKAKTFDAKAKIDFRSQDISMSGNARIRMQKDSAVWVTLSKLGFVVARAMITAVSVRILVRINNE